MEEGRDLVARVLDLVDKRNAQEGENPAAE